MIYEISMPYYEGPMDLLLDLVSKKKIEILEISISELTDNYMQKLEGMKSLDMDITSDFIYMASRLLEIKSRYMLYLSNEEETEDPRLELFEAIAEYAKYRKISEFLGDLHKDAPNRYFRLAPEIYVEEVVDLSKLKLIDMVRALPSPKRVVQQITKEPIVKKVISVEEKMDHINSILCMRKQFYFDEALRKPDCDEQVATMLGMLELARGQKLNLNQDIHLERILVERGV